jgi:uncharacterized cupin superfamily protein
MEDNKYRKFYVDWWNIRKSTIYVVIGIVLLGVLMYAGYSWAARNNWFIPDETSGIPKDAGRIVSFEGQVRILRASTRETIVVMKETYVAAGDTIQTQSDGRAIVEMIDGSRFTVRPNSTVVVKDTSSFLGGKNIRVSVDDGQVNVRTEEQSADTNNIVEVADSENKLLSNTDASFNADAQTNGGEIRISRGGVETTVGGVRTTINENEFASVNNGKLSSREKLLGLARPLSPGNSSQIVDPGGGVSVTFTWADAEGNPASSYYIQISRSPTFASDAIMVDRADLLTREYRLGGLTPGNYYWRLKSTARSGQTTIWNEAWKFTVVKPGESVGIVASDWSVEHVGGNVYLVSGRTNSGFVVRSQGRETLSGPDGGFRLQISSPSTETAVEIGDDRGNRIGFVISLRNGRVLRRY